MTGKAQSEAVTILRNIPLGNAVQLIVSRQDIDDYETTSEKESVSNFYFDNCSKYFNVKICILTFYV